MPSSRLKQNCSYVCHLQPKPMAHLQRNLQFFININRSPFRFQVMIFLSDVLFFSSVAKERLWWLHIYNHKFVLSVCVRLTGHLQKNPHASEMRSLWHYYAMCHYLGWPSAERKSKTFPIFIQLAFLSRYFP